MCGSFDILLCICLVFVLLYPLIAGRVGIFDNFHALHYIRMLLYVCLNCTIFLYVTYRYILFSTDVPYNSWTTFFMGSKVRVDHCVLFVLRCQILPLDIIKLLGNLLYCATDISGSQLLNISVDLYKHEILKLHRKLS